MKYLEPGSHILGFHGAMKPRRIKTKPFAWQRFLRLLGISK